MLLHAPAIDAPVYPSTSVSVAFASAAFLAQPDAVPSAGFAASFNPLYAAPSATLYAAATNVVF